MKLKQVNQLIEDSCVQNILPKEESRITVVLCDISWLYVSYFDCKTHWRFSHFSIGTIKKISGIIFLGVCFWFTVLDEMDLDVIQENIYRYFS